MGGSGQGGFVALGVAVGRNKNLSPKLRAFW